MDAQLKALHAAMGAVLRCRKRVKAATNALRRGQRTYRSQWENSHLLDRLADDLSWAKVRQREAEADLLARWADFNQDYVTDHATPDPTPRPAAPSQPGPDEARPGME